jgi:phosphoglycerate dehydrogenase-like enzyme
MARRPRLAVLCSAELFPSFFDAARQRRLARGFNWERIGAASLGEADWARLAGAEALVTTWSTPRLGPELFERAPRVRIAGHCGGEVKGRFAPEVLARLPVTNAAGPMAPYVAELAVAFLLHSARRLGDYQDAFRCSQDEVYRERHLHGADRETLRGRRVGLVGYGNIGREVARLLQPFAAQLEVCDPYARPRAGIAFTTLARLLGRAEFLVLAAGLTDRTRGMIDAAALARLPDGATLVNVGRGGLVDLPALTREVQSGRLRCALDVTDPVEPLPVAHPLRRLPRTLVTPHVGAAPVEVRHAMVDTVLDDLERFFRGERPKHRVSAAMLARMT